MLEFYILWMAEMLGPCFPETGRTVKVRPPRPISLVNTSGARFSLARSKNFPSPVSRFLSYFTKELVGIYLNMIPGPVGSEQGGAHFREIFEPQQPRFVVSLRK